MSRAIQQYRNAYHVRSGWKFGGEEESYYRLLVWEAKMKEQRIDTLQLLHVLPDCSLLPSSFLLTSSHVTPPCFIKLKQLLASDHTFYLFLFDILLE